MNEVFKKLSAINVNEHIQVKMKLKYLSWSFAWSELMKVYPSSEYEFLDPVFYKNGSCEVSVCLTIEGITRKMVLPVMDNRNNAIIEPTSRHISDARMRCLVKCIAMFGLGIYIYAGEDLPIDDYNESTQKPKNTTTQKDINSTEKHWYTDLPKHKGLMESEIDSKLKTPQQIIDNLKKNYKVSRQVEEQIKLLEK